MRVSILTTHPDKSKTVITARDGSYWISSHGWIFEQDRETPVAHPKVDDIMKAVTRFERGEQ